MKKNHADYFCVNYNKKKQILEGPNDYWWIVIWGGTAAGVLHWAPNLDYFIYLDFIKDDTV